MAGVVKSPKVVPDPLPKCSILIGVLLPTPTKPLVNAVNELDTLKEPDTFKEPVISTFWFNVFTNEAVWAWDELVENDAVPSKDPVILPDTFNEPVILTVPVLLTESIPALSLETENRLEVGASDVLPVICSDHYK